MRDDTDNSSDRLARSPKHGGPELEARLLSFDLEAELVRLRGQASYENRGPTGATLVKEPDLRIVLMAVRSGGGLREHSASGPISIQVLEGSLRVRLRDRTVELAHGQLLAIESDIRHDVEALSDSAFLLTIGRTTYEHVSDRHEPGTRSRDVT